MIFVLLSQFKKYKLENNVTWLLLIFTQDIAAALLVFKNSPLKLTANASSPANKASFSDTSYFFF